MYLPQITAAIPFIALLWAGKPEPSTTQEILHYFGLNAYKVGFELTTLVIFALLSCLIDECYRNGPNEVQKALKKYFRADTDGLSPLAPSGAPTSSFCTTPLTSSLPASSSRVIIPGNA